MAMHKQVRGVGPRAGIFIGGRPQTLLALDDALVFVKPGTLGAIVGAQGAIGAGINAARQHREAKRLDAAGDDMTADGFQGQKRTEVIPFGDVTAARLEGKSGGRARKLVVESSADGGTHLRYPAKTWPDDDVVPFLSEHLGERFTNALA
jgi:hypothetical protein